MEFTKEINCKLNERRIETIQRYKMETPVAKDGTVLNVNYWINWVQKQRKILATDKEKSPDIPIIREDLIALAQAVYVERGTIFVKLDSNPGMTFLLDPYHLGFDIVQANSKYQFFLETHNNFDIFWLRVKVNNVPI